MENLRTQGTPSEVRLTFVGSVGAPEDVDHEGISQAANNFQLQLLRSLGRCFRVDQVISLRFRKFYPHGPFIVKGGAASHDGLTIRYLPFLNHPLLQTPLLALQVAVSLAAAALEDRSEGLVLQYNLYPIPGVATLLGSRLRRRPFVVIAADIHVPGETRPDDFFHRLDFAIQKWALRRANGIVALSSSIVEEISPGARTMVLDGVIGDERLIEVPTDPLRNRSDEDPFVVMYAGQLSELKGISRLLEAFRPMVDDRLRLWITGRGELEDQVRAAVSMDERITYWGYLPYERVIELFEGATVLFNPHRTGTAGSRYVFPSKLIEYLAAGRPVISTPGPGVRENYGEHVEVLQDDSAEEMRRGIRLLESKSPEWLYRKAVAGRAFVSKEKSWSHQGERLASFLSEIVRTHGL